MKTYMNVCVVLLAAGVLDLVRARATSDVSVVSRSGNDVEEACRYEAAGLNVSLPFTMLEKQYLCYKPSPVFLGKINTAANTDAFRALFRQACTQEASVLACIADVRLEAAPCLNAAEVDMFDTVRHFVENSIAVTCANGSEVVATMYGEEVKPLGFGGQLRVLACVNGVAIKTAFNNEADLPAYTLRRYRAMKEGRSCVLNVARSAKRSAEVFGRFMDSLLDTSECIDATTHQVVLCKTLDPQQDTQQ